MRYRIFFFIIFLLASIAPLSAMEKGVFKPPSLEGYTLVQTKQLDKDKVKDGIKETTLEIYGNAIGQYIGKYTCNGIIWEWGVKANNNNDDTINNYILRDSDGDGIFDERYGGNETTYVPDWVKKAGNK